MAAQPQQQQQGDNSLAALWIAIFFFAAAATIIYVFREQLAWFVLKLKYVEILVVSLFVSSSTDLTTQIGALKPASLSWDQAEAVLTMVGDYVRYPFGLILLIFAVILFFGHPALRFKKIHTMRSLLDQEKFNWPQIMPVSNVSLVKESLDKGPWAMALSPMQFAKKYRLLYEEREVGGKHKIGELRERINVGLLRSEAHQVFAMQLGSHWQGIEKQPMHIKALFAVFACRANRDENSAKTILDAAASSFPSGTIDFSSVESTLNRYKDTVLVKRVLERHAFTLTVMASMLELARQDGVLASADFLWLKLVDRPLWFMLNAVGRQTPPSEVSGPVAHWLAEKKLGRRISVPMVEEAVKALEGALKEIIYVPDQEEQ